jgi:carbamoylphosphate synthase large subunit
MDNLAPVSTIPSIRLCFFGHIESWLPALNKSLVGVINERVVSIHNIHTFNEDMRYDYDLFIPFLEHDAITLFDNGLSPACPSRTAINEFKCKNNFHRFVVENCLQILCPSTYTSIEEITSLPIIVKPFSCNSGEYTFVIENTAETMGLCCNELEQYVKKVCDEKCKKDLSYLMQEYIVSPVEYVAHIVADKGKIIVCIVYKCDYADAGNYVKKAVTERDLEKMKKVELDERFIRDFERFLLPLSYTGCCCVDFKIVEGMLRVLEINPRLGGSLTLSGNKADLITVLNALISVFA